MSLDVAQRFGIRGDESGRIGDVQGPVGRMVDSFSVEDFADLFVSVEDTQIERTH